MLRGISPLISPTLLACLHEMGHGDDLVLADAHFPGVTLGRRVLRADGITIASLLDAILPLLVLDGGESLWMMRPGPGDVLDDAVETDFLGAVHRHGDVSARVQRLERNAFYEQARNAFAVVMTGELRPYGNLILRKGVTPLSSPTG